ncbi:MAG: AbrB/MazE/SpoVT family DNA-binding domain-containing protein [Pseudomonadota bacterium]
METSVSKWGNSLAVRLPAEYARALGLSEGAAVDVSVTADGALRLVPAQAFDKAAFLKQLTQLQKAPITQPVMQTLRDAARY